MTRSVVYRFEYFIIIIVAASANDEMPMVELVHLIMHAAPDRRSRAAAAVVAAERDAAMRSTNGGEKFRAGRKLLITCIANVCLIAIFDSGCAVSRAPTRSKLTMEDRHRNAYSRRDRRIADPLLSITAAAAAVAINSLQLDCFDASDQMNGNTIMLMS